MSTKIALHHRFARKLPHRQENCIKPAFSLALVYACRKVELILVCQLGMQQWRQEERAREFVEARSESLTSPFQIPEVFSALEGLELIWLSSFAPLILFN